MSAFDVGLDYVSVHENVVDDLRKPLLGSRGRLSLENQVDAVVKARASRLKGYSAFLAVRTKHFKGCIPFLQFYRSSKCL